MPTDWGKAAQAYQAARVAQERKSSIEHIRPVCRREDDLKRGTAELEEFMRTDGAIAMELLRASKRHINFGEDYDGGGYGVVYFIDGNGLQQSAEAMGLWTAYAKSEEVQSPKRSPITARQAVHAAVHHGNKKATEVVSWLRGELDKIARAAPPCKG